MFKKLLFILFITIPVFANADTITVRNIDELKKANKEAKPGDVIILQDGEWNNVTISLNCNGSSGKPVTFRAQTAGKVIITGNSKLLIGGSYIIVDGFYFTKGFAGDDAVIRFRVSKEQLANNCRVTNTVINDFNNPKRMDDNYWVMLYGKNNRIDHCSFQNKKNMGVLMAVILDDERSRENSHSIDHNYFGFRLPLASNTGEMIRVGVSEHCEFSSNTHITDNFFEHCDGETEIISIKSGRNYVRNNIFKECQGSVVLRHGNYNTVENNLFLGNGKAGTGGVRVINKGQWVVNNIFYKCRGEWFRSPLSIMNGVPNSPANRYVAVTEAVIANNSFLECTPIGICIGSDTERSVPPKDVQFLNNLFSNPVDTVIYNTYDDINGISFAGNIVTPAVVKQSLVPGFTKIKNNAATAPNSKNRVFDSLYNESKTRLKIPLSVSPGFAGRKDLQKEETGARADCGARWFTNQKQDQPVQPVLVNCATASSIIEALEKNNSTKLTINLNATVYDFSESIFISKDVTFTTSLKTPVKFKAATTLFLFQLKAGNTLAFKNVNLDLAGVTDFVSTDTSGSCNHSNFTFSNSHFSNLGGIFFNAAIASIADSIIVYNCTFNNSKGLIFNFTNETANKGLYNVEKLKITNNRFLNCRSPILNMLRGGNDESTMGPYLIFSKNILDNCVTEKNNALIDLFGTQRSEIEKNVFTQCNPGNTVILYEDLVYAVHRSTKNTLVKSGNIKPNKFVITRNNTVQQ